MRIGIIGAGGYIGASLLNSLKDSPTHETIPIYRTSDLSILSPELDLVFHSANPATRYRANANPVLDRKETVEKTGFLLESFQRQRFVLISSISCRTQLNTPYGLNRRECEMKVLEQGGVVLRLGPMFGGSRVKDVIHDIVRGEPIYVSSDTNYAYANVSWVTDFLIHNLEEFSGINEFGARNSISLLEIAEVVDSKSIFSGPNDDQYPIGFVGGPDAREVLEYAKAVQSVISPEGL